MHRVAELLPISPPLLLSVAEQLRNVPAARLHYLAGHSHLQLAAGSDWPEGSAIIQENEMEL